MIKEFLKFSDLFSTMLDIKDQIQFMGIRRDTINIKSTKFHVNVSDCCGLSWQISTLGPEHSKAGRKTVN